MHKGRQVSFFLRGFIFIALFISGCQARPGPLQSSFIDTAPPPPVTSTTDNSIIPTVTPISTPTVILTEPAETSTPEKATAAPASSLLDFFVKPLYPGQAVTLTRIIMLDASNGWADEIGYHLLRTSDGGVTWQDVTPARGWGPESQIFALDAQTAWAAPSDEWESLCKLQCPQHQQVFPSSAIVYQTEDGGRTWQPSQPFSLALGDLPAPGYFAPSAMQFIDRQHGWLMAVVNHASMRDYLELVRTSDGGKTWERVYDSETSNATNQPWVCKFGGMAWADAQTGWMGNSCIDTTSGPPSNLALTLNLLKTSDGGRNWKPIPLPAPSGLATGDPQKDIGCGVLGLVKINPSGTLGTPVSCRVYESASSDYTTYNFYYLSSDSGQSWHSFSVPGAILEVDFVSDRLGWRLTSPRLDGPAAISQTTDGGLTWTQVKRVDWQGSLFFLNETQGWAIVHLDSATAFLHTEDGGKTWIELNPYLK